MNDLVRELKDTYSNTAYGQAAVRIHLFAIKNTREIIDNKVNIKEML